MAYEVPVNKAEIRTLIPHSGLMCLLDEIVQWDDDRSCASVIRIGIRLTHCAATGVYLVYTLSNTARKRRQFTADCGRARRVRCATRISGRAAGRTLTRDTTRLHSFAASDFGDASLRRRRKYGLRVYPFGRDNSHSGRPGDHRATRVRVAVDRARYNTRELQCPRLRNSHRDTAVDTQHLARNVSGFWRCEEFHRGSNFLGRPGPAQRDFA